MKDDTASPSALSVKLKNSAKTCRASRRVVFALQFSVNFFVVFALSTSSTTKRYKMDPGKQDVEGEIKK